MNKGASLSGDDNRINALQYQTSTPGMVIPVVFGITRIPGNLIWYGDFEQHESEAGKGDK